jgi:hypothetical protein
MRTELVDQGMSPMIARTTENDDTPKRIETIRNVMRSREMKNHEKLPLILMRSIVDASRLPRPSWQV